MIQKIGTILLTITLLVIFAVVCSQIDIAFKEAGSKIDYGKYDLNKPMGRFKSSLIHQWYNSIGARIVSCIVFLIFALITGGIILFIKQIIN